MPCIKCGRKLEEGQVFCPECLGDMEDYPIKPGTPVYLPPQMPAQPAKPRKKVRELKPEEEIRQLREAKRWLVLIIAVLLIAFVLLCALLLMLLEQRELSFPLP